MLPTRRCAASALCQQNINQYSVMPTQNVKYLNLKVFFFFKHVTEQRIILSNEIVACQLFCLKISYLLDLKRKKSV